MNKIISYIGFAIKSGKFIAGQIAVKLSKQQIYLILLSNDATENLEKLAINTQAKHKCEIIKCKCGLSELTHIENVKICAILDENIAHAIENYKEIIKIG